MVYVATPASLIWLGAAKTFIVAVEELPDVRKLRVAGVFSGPSETARVVSQEQAIAIVRSPRRTRKTTALRVEIVVKTISTVKQELCTIWLTLMGNFVDWE
jgi:hypothetical protein